LNTCAKRRAKRKNGNRDRSNLTACLPQNLIPPGGVFSHNQLESLPFEAPWRRCAFTTFLLDDRVYVSRYQFPHQSV
jgi:hypothetical protein